ncbi:hypothetical protein C7S13_2807 [Burkholderia cepacia]|nr:hypothetical protein [Burkholderia cepacia]
MLFLRPVKWHLSCLRSKRRGLGRRASDADKSKGARTAEVLAVVVVAGWGVAAGTGGRGSSQGVCECTSRGVHASRSERAGLFPASHFIPRRGTISNRSSCSRSDSFWRAVIIFSRRSAGSMGSARLDSVRIAHLLPGFARCPDTRPAAPCFRSLATSRRICRVVSLSRSAARSGFKRDI